MLKQLLTEFGYCILEMFRKFFTEFNKKGIAESKEFYSHCDFKKEGKSTESATAD